MEAFLSTLPPYVHEFLGRHPPTDVFNLLKELICFAVLYSEDRDRINKSTEELLKKREQYQLELVKEEVEEVEEEQVVPEVPVETKKPIEKPNMPNTFPEWWGHQEFVPPPKKVIEEKRQEELPKNDMSHQNENHPVKEETHPKEEEEEVSENYGTSWVSWEAKPETTTHQKQYRLDRTKSQIIPDLRSYLGEDQNTRMTATSTTAQSAAINKKRHSMVNLKTTPPTKSSITKSSSRVITESPVTEAAPPLKLTEGTKPKKAPAFKAPKPNAAMRARAEHARLQQEELEKKKIVTPPPGASIGLKLKQRASSGIDWESIKKGKPTVAKKEEKK